jgi:hypothetical protein
VARALKKRGLRIGHILVDGTIEPHAATEERLLALTSGKRKGAAADTGPDLFDDRVSRLAAAYRRRAGAIAARAPT